MPYYTADMKKKKFLRRTAEIAEAHRIREGMKFRLREFDPRETRGVESEKAAGEMLEQGVETLRGLQERLYAQDRWGVLVILQGLDASGKDGTIKHVMSGVNPQGCTVSSFKAPSAEELQHDFLWRAHQRMPERGKIGIFNRSYYEEVLVVRVHRKTLEAEKLPEACVSKHIWEERYEDINAFERYLTRNGFLVLKFFLYLSKQEQARRFLKRIEEDRKNWKFSAADIREREYWKEYQSAYEEMIQKTSQTCAPWYIAPADHKWFAHLVVASAVIDELRRLDPQFPEVDKKEKRELAKAQQLLH
jgi:PPK2 family polyphosphate:nucleotide phosphotransferase